MSRKMAVLVITGKDAGGFLLGFLFLVLLALVTGRAIPALAPLHPALVGKVITIDPGHGGIDPGSHDDGSVLEKDIVLEIARNVCYLLARARAVPILTRHGDWEMSPIWPDEKTRHRQDLAARIHIAHRTNSDVFVSIHVNKIGSKSTSGAIVFYSKDKPESKRLATCIQQAIRDVAPFRGRSVLEGDFYVLNAARLPAVIVEVGFISNPEEKELLLTPSYRGRLADAIFRGLLAFFEGS
ncbi:MAG: N-acetylmuramoyl-L-alanine amidase [Firmicutes bacterium]|jgi:N-acetylmuramoyl-L-alanine amidase|nr:N-acetylmuramoyl-L-alanine amidase [Bacillota bacterium]